jgi:hypothetical protein
LAVAAVSTSRPLPEICSSRLSAVSADRGAASETKTLAPIPPEKQQSRMQSRRPAGTRETHSARVVSGRAVFGKSLGSASWVSSSWVVEPWPE